MCSAGGALLFLLNNIFVTDSITILSSILVNIFTTSKLTDKQFLCQCLFLLRSSTMFNICCVSCILVSIFKTSGKRHVSTKMDRFCTAVPLQLVIILAGLLSLWVFISAYILPGFKSFGLINLFEILWVLLQLIHFFNPCINFILKYFLYHYLKEWMNFYLSGHEPFLNIVH